MAILQRAKSSVFGLVADLTTLQQNIDAEAQARALADGDLALLETTAETDLVVAINEVHAAAQAGGEDSLKKAANLSDLAGAGVARTNLDVNSKAEVIAAIEQAKLALGTNFTVDNIAARDALDGLDLGDFVYVTDDGDTKWAIYKPTAVDGEGKGTAWLKLYDQDALENSLTAAGVKQAYESNDNTNAYTDAEKAIVAYLTATKAIDLDDVVLKADLKQTITGAGAADEVASTAAVAAAVAAKAGTSVALQSVVVAAGAVTLANAPVGGIAGILNFATVRYIDGNGIAYDAPVIATADPKVFTVSTDTADQWNGNTVQVQYAFAS